MAAPKTANINVTINDKEYVITRSNFSRLSINRTAKDVCDSFKLSILDDSAYEIEAILLSGESFIQIDYIDDNLKIYKSLSGFVYKINSSFINNRNMLTIEGLVSTSLKDKFEKYSFPWNKVPKFNWSKVLGQAGNNDAVQSSINEANTVSLDSFSKFVQYSLANDFTTISNLFTFNWSSVEDYKVIIDNLFVEDLFSIDKQGTYYVQKYKNLRNDSKELDSKMNKNMTPEEEASNMVKSNGNYTIPIKPHKLIKLICCGGFFSDLLEENFKDYKGTAFYDSGISEAEWYYIQAWYDKMGAFDGLGYKNFDCNYELMFVEDDFVQSKQSYMEFLYNSVLPKCVENKNGKRYTNFYLSFTEKNSYQGGSTAKLNRIDASKKPENIPQYIYYGKFNDSGENKGRMTSFSPTLDILTSMITNGSYMSSDSDISGTNLTGIDAKSEITVNANDTSKEALEGRYKVKWSVLKVSSATTKNANNQIAETDIINVFDKAKELSYRAEATIEGFNTLSPQDYIEIILLPKNDTGTPVYHHLSGTYFILSIEDTIADGKYTSALKLIKNIEKMGDTAIVEETELLSSKEIKYKVTTKNDSSFGKNGSGGTR